MITLIFYTLITLNSLRCYRCFADAYQMPIILAARRRVSIVVTIQFARPITVQMLEMLTRCYPDVVRIMAAANQIKRMLYVTTDHIHDSLSSHRQQAAVGRLAFSQFTSAPPQFSNTSGTKYMLSLSHVLLIKPRIFLLTIMPNRLVSDNIIT